MAWELEEDGVSSPTVSRGAPSAPRCVWGAEGGGGGSVWHKRRLSREADLISRPRYRILYLCLSLLQGLAPRDPGLGVGGGAAGGDGVGGLHSGGRERSRTFRPIPAPDRVRLALCNQVDHSVGRDRVKLCVCVKGGRAERRRKR